MVAVVAVTKGKQGEPKEFWVPPSRRDFCLSKLKSPGLWKCLGLAENPCEVGNAVCAFQRLQLLRVQRGVGSIGCTIIWFEQLI